MNNPLVDEAQGSALAPMGSNLREWPMHFNRTTLGFLLLPALLSYPIAPALADELPFLSRLAIHLDNDEFTGNRPDDRWYSSGGRIDWLSAPRAPAPVGRVECLNLPFSLSQPSARRFSSFGQDIFSQNSRANSVPNPDDRAPGALLYLQTGRSVTSQTIGGSSTHAMVKLETGVTGPAALGEPVQNGLHDLLGVDRVTIWQNQIRPRLGLNLHIACTHQLAAVDPEQRNPLVLNARYDLSIGNLLTQAGFGLAIAAGPDARQLNLPRPARLANPIARKVKRWGAIAGVSLRAVFYDAMTDGEAFGYQSRVSSRLIQADAFVGLTIALTDRWQLSYALIRRTPDFEGPGVDAKNFKMQTIGQIVLQAPLY